MRFSRSNVQLDHSLRNIDRVSRAPIEIRAYVVFRLLSHPDLYERPLQMVLVRAR
jgi:hypothetical protein